MALAQYSKADKEIDKLRSQKSANQIPWPIRYLLYGIGGVTAPFWVPNKVQNKGKIYLVRLFSIILIMAGVSRLFIPTELSKYIVFCLYALIYVRLLTRDAKENTVLFANELALLAVVTNLRILDTVLDGQYMNDFAVFLQFCVGIFISNAVFGYIIANTTFKDENDNYVKRKDFYSKICIEEKLKHYHFNTDLFKFELLYRGAWTEKMLEPWKRDRNTPIIKGKTVYYKGEWFWFQVVEREPLAFLKFLEHHIREYSLIAIFVNCIFCLAFESLKPPIPDLLIPFVLLLFNSIDLKRRVQSFRFLRNCIIYH
mmetsp:Transcript_36598/g.32811  ORF Transcript_36598/g.32811 Transcript_36598/m.32811 type:complete len:313 (-) Transcript_36598:769-1707(-)